MENLFKSRWKTENLIKKYASNHDWEIGYQRYYQFLIRDLGQFLQALNEGYKKGEVYTLDNISGKSLTVGFDIIRDDFIDEFVSSYYVDGFAIGQIIYKQDQTTTIVFNSISFDDLLKCFYDELQKVEYTMKTPGEMQMELDNYMVNPDNGVYTLSDEEEINEEECDELKKYYDFLDMLISNIKSYYNKKVKRRRGLKSLTFKIDKEEEAISFKALCSFLDRYKLANYEYRGGWLFINFLVSVVDVDNACATELAKIDYDLNGGVVRERKLPFYAYYESSDEE